MYKLRFLVCALLYTAFCWPVFAQDAAPPTLSEPTKQGPAWLDQWPVATPTPAPDHELEWYAQQIQEFPQQTNLRLQYARVLYQRSQQQAAISQIESLLDLFPLDKELQLQLAQWRLEQGQNSAVIEQLQAFLKHYLVDPEYYYLLGLAYQAQGQSDQAHQAFVKVLLLKPDHALSQKLENPDVYQSEIQVILSNQKLASILKQSAVRSKIIQLEELLQQQPQLKQAYHELALLLESQGQFAAAANWRQQLMALANCYANNQTLYARYLFWAGHLETAGRILRTQLACAADAEAADWLGQVLRKQGQLDSALQHYEQSLKQWPSQTRLLIGLAQVHVQAQNYAEAAKVLTRLKQFDHSAWYVRSQILMANAQPLSAIQDLQKALSASKRLEYQQALLLAYIQAGMVREAQQALQAYRQFSGVQTKDVFNYEKMIQALPHRGRFEAIKGQKKP